MTTKPGPRYIPATDTTIADLAAASRPLLDEITPGISRLVDALDSLEAINIGSGSGAEEPMSVGQYAADDWYVIFEVERIQAVWKSLDLLAGLDDKLYQTGLYETGAYITITLCQPGSFQLRGHKVDPNLIATWIAEAKP
ncbi:MAG: hypothetical protein M5U01_43055 [Ardenticatenaceae bacterium]|nr:hypothetical protein [Ardenticatenaceae bacterium]HBY96724.1 hypothetical protein [Chloroflexota bacterium]